MKTLAEVKAIFNTEKVFETATSFGINVFGKYCPNITFIIPKDFAGNPLQYRADAPTKEMIQNMNISFNGSTGIIFGDFWKSQKGGACFRPKNVATAQHVLVRVDWGGAFRDSRGSWGGVGEVYFRRAASNGGGTGYDYWVFPIGFRRLIVDKEIDGEIGQTDYDVAQSAQLVRNQFIKYDREQAEKAAAETQAKADAEAASKAAKESGLSARLEAVNVRLAVLEHKLVELGESSFFWIDGMWRSEYQYSEEKVTNIERRVAQLEAEKAEQERKRLAREQFQLKFEAFNPRIEALCITVEFMSDKVRLAGDFNGQPYSDEGLAKFATEIDRREREAAEARAKADAEAEYQRRKTEALALGLPTDIRIWCRRGGRTNAGDGWVIGADGQDRGNTAWHNPRPRHTTEGDKIWEQILPGEVVLKWSKSCSAAPHEFEVVYMPTEGLTEAQLERIQEIQDELNRDWAGACGLASGNPSPPVGLGWGLVVNHTKPEPQNSAMAEALRKAGLK